MARASQEVDRQRISGSFLRPAHVQYDQDGDFSAISAEHKVVEPTIVTDHLEFATGTVGVMTDTFCPRQANIGQPAR